MTMLRTMLPLFAVAMLSACAAPPPTPENKPIGMANPASQYCIKLGGKLEIAKQADGGEIGMCHLPDGTIIEEWQLFRRDNKQ